MASDSIVKDLRSAEGLARHLWDQCRDSPSSYKLLSGSLKKIRNILEELGELEILEATAPGPDDVKLINSIDRTHQLLVRLDGSLQTYRSSESKEVSERTVADFKTRLDVFVKKLTAAYDAMSTGEIQLKLDTDVIPALTSPSSRYGSTSASGVESAAGHRQSSRTSSAYSLIVQESSGRQVDPGSPSFREGSDQERQPCEEKEVYDHGAASDIVVTATTPSVDWKSPFALPDPMSTSIEQASNMILRDDVTLTPDFARARSSTSPGPFMKNYVEDSERISDQQTAHGIASLSSGNNATKVESNRSLGNAVRPRTASESLAPSYQGSYINKDDVGPLTLHVSKSTEFMDSTPIHHPSSGRPNLGHCALNVTEREPRQRGRTHSNSSTKLPVRSGEGEMSGINHLERKDLSVVLETPPNETGEPLSAAPQDLPTSLDLKTDAITPSTQGTEAPPPPTRRPPVPPRPIRAPKIPQRSATYRIVNAQPADESSSEEDDLYSSSKPSSPAESKWSFESQNNDQQDPADSSVRTTVELSPENTSGRRPGRQRMTHAQRVLKSRAEYTPSADLSSQQSSAGYDSPKVHSKMSTPNLKPESRLAEDAPPLKRHSTSIIPSRDRPSKFEASTVQGAETLYHARSVSQNDIPQSDPNGVGEKEVALESPAAQAPVLVDRPKKNRRVSVDAALDVHDPFEASESTPQIGSAATAGTSERLAEWYAPDASELPDNDASEFADLDLERVNSVVHFWNSCAWDQAELYLTGYLESLVEQDRLAIARRVQHLLGICASFKGRWSKAIPLFLSVLRTPIIDISELDDGDCAAAYWLGDCYSLLNEQSEAMVSYCIAERSSLFSAKGESSLRDCIAAEQDAVQPATSRAGLQLRLAQQTLRSESTVSPSILDTHVVASAAARDLLANEPRRAKAGALFQLDETKARSSALSALDKGSLTSKYHRMRITPRDFEPNTSWPMLYDPFFSMANVRSGRLLSYECDLLAVFNSNANAKIPNSGSLNFNWIDCFTSTDLNWLIKTIRECLKTLEMEWSEVANVQGTWFVVRYSFMLSRIATTQYFSIRLFKQSLNIRYGRSGFGVEICPDGICAARIIRSDIEHHKGVHMSESKRIKKFIREYLDNAAKQQNK